MKSVKKKPYSLRLQADKAEMIGQWAEQGRRSFTAEVDLLIDQGIAWRNQHGNRIPDQDVLKACESR